MVLTDRRMIREQRTVEAMIRLYCRGQHGTRGALCAGCQALDDYARRRLARCPFQAAKPTCAKCTVHCYKPAMRDQIRAVMRYAGPRMLLHRPLLAVLHLLDARVKPATPADLRSRRAAPPARPLDGIGGRPSARERERL